jgi:hypothetical protein
LALKTLSQSDRADYAHSLLDIVEWYGDAGRLPTAGRQRAVLRTENDVTVYFF